MQNETVITHGAHEEIPEDYGRCVVFRSRDFLSPEER